MDPGSTVSRPDCTARATALPIWKATWSTAPANTGHLGRYGGHDTNRGSVEHHEVGGRSEEHGGEDVSPVIVTDLGLALDKEDESGDSENGTDCDWDSRLHAEHRIDGEDKCHEGCRYTLGEQTEGDDHGFLVMDRQVETGKGQVVDCPPSVDKERKDNEDGKVGYLPGLWRQEGVIFREDGLPVEEEAE